MNNKSPRVVSFGLGICALILGAGHAMAHHSFAMFDNSKNSSAMGTVAKVEWSNPHVWLWVYCLNEKRAYDLYGFEAGSIGVLARAGWTSDTLKAGEKVTVDYHPLKDGRKGGNFIGATFADGSRTPELMGAPPAAVKAQ